jgi:hypothetical protein
MKKIIVVGLLAGLVLLILSILGLYITIWFFPGLAAQYYDPAFDTGPDKYLLYYVHPFVIALALSWFWDRFKTILKGSFLTRGMEFGVIYTVIAILPSLWLTYSAISVSLAIVATWLLFGLLQGLIAGLIFEKLNP